MKNLSIIGLAIVLVQCEPVIPQNSSQQKQIFFDDHDYESIVGNVQVVPINDRGPDMLANPVVNLLGDERIYLDFDLLTDQFENLSARILHCNKDWKPSRLRDMEFLNEINTYRITEFDYSVNTVQPYINYRLALPKPKISGNYIVSVHRRANPNDVLFTRKFLIYETAITIDQLVRISTTVSKRDENQQIEFSLDYEDLLVNSPVQDLSTYILQNHNWSTSLKNLQPTLIRANEGIVEYRPMDLSSNFSGWNEFRWTDLRTLSIAGRNVARVQNTGNEVFATLGTDVSRAKKRYSQNFQDINGNYVIQNNDPGQSTFNADYVRARFLLKHEKVQGNVFVIGRFNNWKMDDANLMNYDTQNAVYYTDLFLKQGYYDYQYVIKDGNLPPYFFEGSHFQAENDYEILVYYRRPGNIHDELMGYRKFKSIEDL